MEDKVYRNKNDFLGKFIRVSEKKENDFFQNNCQSEKEHQDLASGKR